MKKVKECNSKEGQKKEKRREREGRAARNQPIDKGKTKSWDTMIEVVQKCKLVRLAKPRNLDGGGARSK